MQQTLRGKQKTRGRPFQVIPSSHFLLTVFCVRKTITLVLWTCNLWTVDRCDKIQGREDEEGRVRILGSWSRGPFGARSVILLNMHTRAHTHTHTQTDTHTHTHTQIHPSWMCLVLLQAYTSLYLSRVCVCKCWTIQVFVFRFHADVLPPCPDTTWCIQHDLLYACMYLCIMNRVKCIYTHLYVLIYSCSVLDPLGFFVVLNCCCCCCDTSGDRSQKRGQTMRLAERKGRSIVITSDPVVEPELFPFFFF